MTDGDATRGTIVYYVHHHGSGHAHRAAAIAAHCRTPVVGVGSRPAPPGWPGSWHELPLDTGGTGPGGDGTEPVDVTAGGTLHWVPRRHDGLRTRTAAVSALLAAGPARLLVADVSVEIALLARLHGIPVAVVAQPGERLDRPHRTAYDLAEVLLAPWPADPPRPARPELAARTVHLGGLSRYDGRTAGAPPGRRRVLVLTGSGDGGADPRALAAAAGATPEWTWRVAGGLTGTPVDSPPNLTHAGWTGEVWTALQDADVVVGHAGQNVVAEIAAARRAAVILPAERPHGEQAATGAVLRAAGLATVRDRWPAPAEWPGVLDEALARGGAGWSRWSDGRAAERAAAVLDGIAA
ncbi:glycosyltransferase [Pseudonocardia sp. ICBG1293]|uniref:glycosyltransferase n=1 Tax=Pseudonocardia sp. ICBG1293 TaxID=2844382 RepID=UPI001CCD083D|nr:glycosyltransferase [Pseudonocardia sp. ICBG1293]